MMEHNMGKRMCVCVCVCVCVCEHACVYDWVTVLSAEFGATL